MSMDWLTGLGVQDQSIEAQLARRDLGRKLALMEQVASRAQQGRQFEENLASQEKDREERLLLRKALMDQTQQYREQSEKDRLTTERRNRYNTIVDNLARSVSAGQAPRITDPEQAGLIREFEGEGAISPEQSATDIGQGEEGGTPPPLAWLYRKHDAEAAALKAKQTQEHQDHQQKLADEAEKRDQQRLKNENDRLKMAQDKEARAQKDFERRQKMLDARLEAMPVHLRSKAGKLADAAAKATTQGMFEDDTEFIARKQKAINDAYDKVENDAKAAGQMSVKPTLGSGRGGGAGTGTSRFTIIQQK